MLRLSFILAAVHFCLAWGLRFGFRRTEQLDSEFAAGCANFAEKIEFVLTQPGRWACDALGWADGSVGFWILMVLTSILWGNVIAFIVRRICAALFR